MRLTKMTSSAAILILLGAIGLVACGNGPASDEKTQESETAGPTGPTSSNSSQRNQDKPEVEQEYESEFCWVLHTRQPSKKVSAPIRDQFSGQYGDAKDTKRMKTWNVQTICKDFLVAIPLWADVSPPIMTPTGETTFEDSMGGVWDFDVGNDGEIREVTATFSDGVVSEMVRIGDPYQFE